MGGPVEIKKINEGHYNVWQLDETHEAGGVLLLKHWVERIVAEDVKDHLIEKHPEDAFQVVTQH